MYASPGIMFSFIMMTLGSLVVVVSGTVIQNHYILFYIAGMCIIVIALVEILSV